MDTISFTENLSILPKMLDENLEVTIEELVRAKYKNICNKKWGYISSIQSVRIIENLVNRVSSNIFFKLAVKAERFLPREGLEVDATVQMCFQHGILCKFHELSILVPMSTIQGGKQEGPVIKVSGKVIKKGDTVTVRLSSVKYEKRKFSAIALLLTENEMEE